jgi:branched-subunit amino acid transport protein AzlD
VQIALKILFLTTVLASGAFRAFAQSIEDFPTIDARKWSPQKNLFTVSGQCLYFQNTLVSPETLDIIQGSVSKFPILFNDNDTEKGKGCGTFAVRLILPDVKRKLALYIPQIYSSYKLWVNDSMLAETGKVSLSRHESKPQWVARIVTFETTTDTLNLLLQVCNFHHAKGGIKEFILLGTESKILERNRINIVANMSEVVILILIGFVFILTFIFSEQKKFVIYFSLLSVTWAIRSLFSNQYLYTQYDPNINWNILVRIEYIMLFLAVIWGTFSVSNLYKEESNAIISYFLVLSNILFIVFVASHEPSEFTQWLNIYLGTAVILLLYIIAITIRAIAHRKSGIYLLAASIIVGVLIFGYDLAVYKLAVHYNPVVFSLGYIAIFVLIGFNLALQINVTTGKSNQHPFL